MEQITEMLSYPTPLDHDASEKPVHCQLITVFSAARDDGRCARDNPLSEFRVHGLLRGVPCVSIAR